MDQMNPVRPPVVAVGREPWLGRALRAVGIEGENPTLTSPVRPSSICGFCVLRSLVGLVVLYDAWASLSWSHKTEMAHFLGVGMHSPWVALTVAAVSFVKLALAASLLSGRSVRAIGWVGVVYGLFVWIAIEHGGDFGQTATDPGLGLPYVILFLYIIGIERLGRDPDISHNQILALARISFGLLWAYDAALKFQPYFLQHYLDYLLAAQKDVAGTWRAGYDQVWIVISQAVGPTVVAYAVGIAEAAIAVSLLTGRWLRVFGPVGIALSLVIWSTAEEWGGPYSMGVAAMMPMRLLGMAVVYALALIYVWMLYNPLDLLRGRRISLW